MSSGIILSQADNRPMYRQIMDEIRLRVASGDWAPGFRLPSIRELASELGVSVITVKRAYLELEHAGVIVTRHGMGSFVSEEVDVDAVKTEELHRSLERAAALAVEMGLSAEELTALLRKYATDRRSLIA